ncbi:MAG TPA: FliA/WhiG family RNA polymerase sigma factor [Dehalococcoidia bacterium]|nr:FliA/WhiG family RNA polymerase sigma factor [Dehalococcoidia bacterium]
MDGSREEMILRNLPLVAFVVGKMTDENGSSVIDRDDAIAYGIEGLIQAVDAYDPTRGTTFASFAIRRIRGSVLDAIRKLDVLPRSLRKGARELERATLELATDLGRWPSQRELATRLGMSLEELQSLAGHSSSRVVSLERVMEEKSAEGASPWEASDPDEFADPAAAADRKAAMMLLNGAVTNLSHRDRAIVQLRYGRGMAFHEIGQLMGLSESRVCQLHKRILASLRHRLAREMDLAA